MASLLRVACDALLFDMDGVLVDSRAVVERTWRRWAARHGLDPEPIIRVAHGRRTSETLAEAVPHLARPAEVAWLDAAEEEDVDGLVAVPGAAALLASLPAERWAVVTSAHRALARLRLAACGLPEPAVLVAGDEIARGKPAPDGYLLGARRLGAAPAACVVLEDTPPGIAAGRAAGARVVALATTYGAEQLAAADAVVHDLRDVRAQPGAAAPLVLRARRIAPRAFPLP